MVKLLNYILFGFLILVSKLPMQVLYVIGYFLFLVLYYILGYRKKVVFRNLEGSLNKDYEIQKTARRFYFFLSGMFMETIKCLTISRKCLLKRIYCDNPEIMEEYALAKKSVIIMGGHYGNWEMLIYAMNLLFPHQAIGVGKPLSNKVLNNLINARRSKTGMIIIHAGNIKEEFAHYKDELTASLFLSDQYPGLVGKGYALQFLNKHTEFMYGAEKYALKYDFPVLYADVERLRRGRYKVHLIKVTDKPGETQYGEIITRYVQLLEQTIHREPHYWLWSHKRWKHLPGFYE